MGDSGVRSRSSRYMPSKLIEPATPPESSVEYWRQFSPDSGGPDRPAAGSSRQPPRRSLGIGRLRVRTSPAQTGADAAGGCVQGQWNLPAGRSRRVAGIRTAAGLRPLEADTCRRSSRRHAASGRVRIQALSPRRMRWPPPRMWPLRGRDASIRANQRPQGGVEVSGRGRRGRGRSSSWSSGSAAQPAC